MRKVIGIRTCKETQYVSVLGERLKEQGHQVNYMLSDDENLDIDALVLIIDKSFNFIEACSYLLTFQRYKHKLIWAISENEENEREKNILYHLGICHYLKQSTECNEEVHSIVNTMGAVKKIKDVPLLDETKHALIIDDKESELTPKEYKLLSELYANINEVMLYNDITQLLWGKIHTEKYATRIANIIHGIRLKLIPESKIIIKTIRKKGYMLVEAN